MAHFNELGLQAVDLGDTTRVSLTLTTACQEHVSHVMRRELDLIPTRPQDNVFIWLSEVLERTADEAACCGEGYRLVVAADLRDGDPS